MLSLSCGQSFLRQQHIGHMTKDCLNINDKCWRFFVSYSIFNNYSLKWRFIYSTELRGSVEYLSLGTDTEGNNCFSICQNIEMKQEINFYVTLK